MSVAECWASGVAAALHSLMADEVWSAEGAHSLQLLLTQLGFPFRPYLLTKSPGIPLSQASTLTAKQLLGGLSCPWALGILNEPLHTLCCFWSGMGYPDVRGQGSYRWQ